jgi:hypothetical protein
LKLMFSPDDKFEIIFGDELQNILGKITSWVCMLVLCSTWNQWNM